MIKLKNKYSYILLWFLILYVLSLVWLYFYQTNNVEKIHNDTNNFSIENIGNDILLNTDLFIKGNYWIVIENLENKEYISNDEKLLLIEAYLNYWNSYYLESEYSKKALDILNNKQNTFKVLFFKWYANEIIKNYEESAKFYYEILKLDNISDLERWVVYNQIWHLAQLMWNITEAYNFYIKAYQLNNYNVSINLNLWRILIHQWNLLEWKKYLEYALYRTSNNFLKSEIYYWLSSISLYEDNYKNIEDFYNKVEESLNYSKESLKYNYNYPLAHVWYSRALILLNEDLEDAKNHLNKALEIYENLSEAYKYLWYLELNNKNYNEAIKYFEKSVSSLEKDITLMWYEKDNTGELYFQISFAYAFLWNKEKTLEFLKNIIDSKSQKANNLLFQELFKENNWKFELLKWNTYFDNLLSLLNIN